jgi:hypothetical protein
MNTKTPVLVSTILSILGRFIKLHYIVGSKHALFSAAECITPLTGLYGGWRASALLFGVQTIISLITAYSITPLLLVYHFPSFCASVFLSTKSRSRILVPLSCIGLFIAHPVGWQTGWYALFWLIPLIVSLLDVRGFFLQALGATFTAHAVGTIIYLYFKGLTHEHLLILAPIVLLERLTFATGMTVAQYAIQKISSLVSFRISLLFSRTI